MKNLRKAVFSAALTIGVAAGSTASLAAQEVDAGQLLAMTDPTIVIELNGAEGATEGAAALRAAGDQTEITIDVSGAPAGESLAGYLVSGSCGAGGETVAQLGTIEVDESGAGQLNAVLPLPLEAVTAGEVAVEVRPEGEAPAEALLCGAHSPDHHGEEHAPVSPTPEPQPEETPEPEDENEEEPVPPADLR